MASICVCAHVQQGTGSVSSAVPVAAVHHAVVRSESEVYGGFSHVGSRHVGGRRAAEAQAHMHRTVLLMSTKCVFCGSS